PQPPSALLTPLMSCEMSTSPPFANAMQAVAGCVPSAMLTPRISSLMATVPSPSQSPTHCARAGSVAKNNPAAVSATANTERVAMNRDACVVIDRASSSEIGSECVRDTEVERGAGAVAIGDAVTLLLQVF